MSNIKCYIDELGYLIARPESGRELLGMYLEQDIQGSTIVCDEFIKYCNKVINKEIPEWKIVGNAHRLTIYSENIIIKNLFCDSFEPLQLSHQEFLAALKEWKRCLEIINMGNMDGEIPVVARQL